MLVLSRLYNARWLLLFIILYCGLHVLTAQAKSPVYSPYRQAKSNQTYNSLFCDSLSAYQKSVTHNNVLSRTVLFSQPADLARLVQLTQSSSATSCQKLLAFHLLHQLKAKPSKTTLLGVVVEVAFANGLDTLAAYRDGRVTYIHRDGKVDAIRKVDTSMSNTIHKLFQEAQRVVENTQYWPEQRLGPPQAGQVRISFLASDGIHFGQDSMNHLELSPLAGPVLTAATELLIKILKN